MMKRREALQSLGMVSTHALFPSILTGFVASCAEKPNSTRLFFSAEEEQAVIKAIDLILPASKFKAASETNTQTFLDEIFAKCLTKDAQDLMHSGLQSLITAMNESNPFESLSIIDQSAFNGNQDFAWFLTFKKYTLIGFFTSQEGETVASNYLAIPGPYQGDIPLDQSTLNYGHTSLRF